MTRTNVVIGEKRGERRKSELLVVVFAGVPAGMHSREEKDYIGATLISLELGRTISPTSKYTTCPYKYFKYTTASFFFFLNG